MDTLLILIASPDKASLTPAMVEQARSMLPATAQPCWLELGEAAEIPFLAPAGFNPRAMEEEVRLSFRTLPVDIAILPAANRRKKLLVADMDSTMIGQECIDELADMAGVGAHVADITARAMRGELDFEAALKERVGLLEGLDATIIDRVIKERITFTPGGATLLATMRHHGARTALVSGGFTPFTAHVAATLGFDEHRANRLAIADGRLTGEVIEPILGRAAKIEALEHLTHRLGITADDALTVGDGANDAGMIEAAGLGVALHGKETLRQVADVRIDHGDLTALLYLQGYRGDQFVHG